MVREASGQLPLLMKTNYSDWSTMMRVMLRARGLWAAIKDGAADEVEDWMAMGGSALWCAGIIALWLRSRTLVGSMHLEAVQEHLLPRWHVPQGLRATSREDVA
jgi:hypothetical protein